MENLSLERCREIIMQDNTDQVPSRVEDRGEEPHLPPNGDSGKVLRVLGDSKGVARFFAEIENASIWG